MLGFLPPVFGLVPRYCEPPAHGGGGGHGGSYSAAGEGGQTNAGEGGEAGGGAEGGQLEGGAGASAEGGAGASAEGGAGASAEGGAGGEPTAPPDRVREPLLGCVTGVSGKLTPGIFEVLPPYPSLPSPDYDWLTDWSGDGHTALGVYTSDPVDDATDAFFLSWQPGTGYALDAQTHIDLTQFNETPTYLSSCDGSIRARLDGDGTVTAPNGIGVATNHQFFHDYFRLSEDGSSLSFMTGIRNQVRPWTEWHSTRGQAAAGALLLDWVESLSWDGLTAFGTSSCYTHECSPPKTFRWRPLEDNGDVTTTAPTPIVAADGVSIVYNYNDTHIGIWHEESIDIVDCIDACQPLAWSSRAQIILVARNGDYELWTRPHGFRLLRTLLTVPDGWSFQPTGLSLDGWTVTGRAYSPTAPASYARATLNADAYQ